ncbi:gypsy-like retrotransposase [Cucumis melo var. makuwa]|uniref:Gypsy-like retrotransposase n=1 Tax=Cucumis melo var. makuwa TaxID=1194695 RepID=A0A5D3CY85_CUCMM|nr:gypsy-like retrotransposase [Cucumis melo var. makuwa]
MSIDFSDEDLLLGSKLHNRPLYVFGYVREQRVDQILIDNGSAVNIMPKLTMRQLGILMDELSNSKLVIQGFNQGSQRLIDVKFYLKNDNSPEAVPVEIPLVNRKYNLQLKSLASREPHKSTGTFHSGKGERRKKGESPFVESLQGLKVGDIEVLKESFTTPLTKITKQEIKIDLTKASLPQKWTKDEFDPKAYKLMAKASYDFTTYTKFKSLKFHEQPELSSIQKKLLREGHAIPVSRKGLGYKSPELNRIIRKGKEKVVDSNHITVEEVDSMEEKEGGPHVKTGSNIDTKKKEPTSRMSVWYQIKHTDVKNYHGKEFAWETRNKEKVKSHVITSPFLKELEIETPKEDAEDVPQSLEDGG